MSQDQHKQPESASSEPQTPPKPASTSQSRTGLDKTSKATKPTENLVQRLVKDQSIKALRGTIGLLETVVKKLKVKPARELSPAAAPPSSTPISTPVLDSTNATPEQESVSIVVEPSLEEESVGIVVEPSLEEETVSIVVEPSLEVPASDTQTVAPKPTAQELASGQVSQPTKQKPAIEQLPEPTKPKLIDRLLPSFNRVQAFWDATLQKVRSLLPAAWNQKLSDWGLTGAIAGIVVVVLLTTVALLPKTPTQVAKAPPNTIDAPPELKAPEPPKPVEVEPQPTPELTPEQSLIAAIQNQVAEITGQYGNGMIKSIQANFPGSRLVVKVSDGWYDLKEPKQNKLADDILRRSKELDFSKLEITDMKGTLLARSPVVGSNMVIVKRQQLATNL